MAANRASFVLLAFVPIVLAAYMSGHNTPTIAADDADILKVLVKEVQELKLVVKTQGDQVKELQRTVEKQAGRIDVLEKRRSECETMETDSNSTDQQQISRNRKPNASRQEMSPNMTKENVGENPSENHASKRINGDFDITSIHRESAVAHKLHRGVRGPAEEGVAFCVYLDHNINAMSPGHALKFNKALLNEGNGYNVYTGIFTTPVSGVYLFTFFIDSWGSSDRAGVRLLVDNVHQLDAIVDEHGGHYMMGGNSAVLRLAVGQAVWLESYLWDDNDIDSNSRDRLVTFSGILMY